MSSVPKDPMSFTFTRAKRQPVKVEIESDPEEEEDDTLASKKAVAKSSSSKSSKSLQKMESAVQSNLPPHFIEAFNAIAEMRKAGGAPVDTMGCSRLADTKEDPKVFRFQTLVALMLSSQTKDEVTAAAMTNLKNFGLTIDKVLATSESKINELISKVGFHNRKAGYIKQTAQILRDQYDNDIPGDVQGLCSLPGVGPKMAYLTMLCAWDQVVGIGVDVHVHRICGRLGWVKKAKTPEDTRKDLERWLPKEYWSTINHMLVGFGQTICKPVAPNCWECKASAWCPVGKKVLRSQPQKPEKKARKSKTIKKEAEEEEETPDQSNESESTGTVKEEPAFLTVKSEKSNIKEEEGSITVKEEPSVSHSLRRSKRKAQQL